MTARWSSYEPYRPPYVGLLSQLPRKEARASFEDFMASRPERWRQLARLLDGRIQLRDDDASIQALNDWFRAEVEANPDEPERLRNRWYAVVHDIGVVLGDVEIRRNPGLAWEFYTVGKRHAAYQRPVVMGFTRVADKRYNVDPALVVATYGHRVIAGMDVEENLFLRMLDAAAAAA